MEVEDVEIEDVEGDMMRLLRGMERQVTIEGLKLWFEQNKQQLAKLQAKDIEFLRHAYRRQLNKFKRK